MTSKFTNLPVSSDNSALHLDCDMTFHVNHVRTLVSDWWATSNDEKLTTRPVKFAAKAARADVLFLNLCVYSVSDVSACEASADQQGCCCRRVKAQSPSKPKASHGVTNHANRFSSKAPSGFEH